LNALEDENNRLREQLIRASKGEKITELPAPKKQKPNVVQKIPLPSYNQMQFLHPNYWVQMFQGNGQQGGSGGTGPKVVLFVALFCVALFLVKSPEKDLDVAHERVGRILQGMHSSELNVNPDMKSVQKLFETLQGDEMDDRLKETLGNIKIRWNKESEQITFIFPSSVRIQDGPGGEISISKKLLGEICEQMNHVNTEN
jgi:hypothetical protein